MMFALFFALFCSRTKLEAAMGKRLQLLRERSTQNLKLNNAKKHEISPCIEFSLTYSLRMAMPFPKYWTQIIALKSYLQYILINVYIYICIYIIITTIIVATISLELSHNIGPFENVW